MSEVEEPLLPQPNYHHHHHHHHHHHQHRHHAFNSPFRWLNSLVSIFPSFSSPSPSPRLNSNSIGIGIGTLNSPSNQHPSLNLYKWLRNRRLNKLLSVYLVLLITLGLIYSNYLHRLIFIDYSLFPPPSAQTTIYPGLDPELSAPVFNTTTTLQHASLEPPIVRLNSLIDYALQEIDQRLQSVWFEPSTFKCVPSKETQDLINTRFLDPNTRAPNGKFKVMIALNLHASQSVLPTIIHAILNLLRYLGPEKVFVSIYENGSWDHTPEGLAHLGAVLTGLGVGHHIRSAKQETEWKGADRIKILSEYRNMALSSIDRADRVLNGLTDLVFINDVFLCTQDILELIWERRSQSADASCGTDWRESSTIFDRLQWTRSSNDDKDENSKSLSNSTKPVVFYDSWVARSLAGKTLRPRLDFFTEYRDGYQVIFDKESSPVYRNRFRNSVAVPVYSCWNGIIALDPSPFLSSPRLKFRAADRSGGECPSSECQLLAKDFWSLGFQRWIIVPKVAVTYTQNIYYSPAIVAGSNRDHRPGQRLRLETSDDQDWNEKIDWTAYPKPQTVVCWPDMYTFHADFEWNQVLESPYNPKLKIRSQSNDTSIAS